MTAPTYPLFPVFAFLGFVLALLPLSWHLEAWNSATCYYMIWASLACLNQFINSVVWANNALNPAPVWCDISTRIILGASVGLPAASLCINRRLYKIARVQAVMVTAAEKRRAVLMDTLICVVFPILCMVLAYVVQGHRFNIYEEIGCQPAIYNTLLAYFLVNWWPLVLGLISAVYCILSLCAFAQRRAQFKEFLSSNSTSLSFSRYFRLMALATTELMLTLPISSYAIYLNATAQPIEPWVSWYNTHYDFSRVEQIPSVIWRMDSELSVALQLGQWLNPLCAFIFFAYFGLASEAQKHYKTAFWAVAYRFGISPAPKANLKGFSSPSLPRYGKSSSTAGLPAYVPPSPPHYSVAGSPSSSLSVLDEKADVKAMSSVDAFGGRTHIEPPSPSLPSAPVSPSSTAFSPSSYGHSIAFTELELEYGARIPSFITIEALTVSEPSSPSSHRESATSQP